MDVADCIIFNKSSTGATRCWSIANFCSYTKFSRYTFLSISPTNLYPVTNDAVDDIVEDDDGGISVRLSVLVMVDGVGSSTISGSIAHLTACFHLHLELEAPPNSNIYPISYVLNKLPKNPPKERHRQEYWPRIWPKLCAILYNIDSCCHLDEDFTPSKDPDPGRLLLKWIQSANENPFDRFSQRHQNLNNIGNDSQSLYEAS
ncbi:hypothetical protein BDA99DRAFT_604093 [Phascolomyces articulosus]|uniref:Uncharacterized protein n=1 Tax=Phascolomyces articulosus TaxID=60185 RepID=A0AAD5K399_9FUNG|nr:hypothetical protein BDA99DRAFT_604093 [Phascolomyces articulosus]